MTPDLVIFDCDGVIVDSEGPTLHMLRDDLAARGLDLPLDRAMDMFIGATMSGVAAKARSHGADLPPTGSKGSMTACMRGSNRAHPLSQASKQCLTGWIALQSPIVSARTGGMQKWPSPLASIRRC